MAEPVKLYWLGAFVALAAILVVGCGTEEEAKPGLAPAASEAPTAPAPAGTPSADQIITLGDIDPDEPAKKIERFQPLASYLAKHLKGFGIVKGEVVIAQDIEEMAGFLKDGTVDIYFDSACPSLAVEELSQSEVILRRWKGEEPTYWSLYIARQDSGIASVEDFVGKVLAFEEGRSTSGFCLPAGTLIQRGFTLTEIDLVDPQFAVDEIGYLFSDDEENTVEWVLEGRVSGGGISNQDYDELPKKRKQQIIAFDHTMVVPRQLVSVRPGLDSVLLNRVRELLTNLDQAHEYHQTPDLSPVIREIFDRPGWQGSLAILATPLTENTGPRTAVSYDRSPDQAPLLHIEYTTASTSDHSATTGVFEARVDSSSDDAEESADGGVDVDSSDLELMKDKDEVQSHVGMRWTDIQIPRGAIILNAYIEFAVDDKGSQAAGVRFYGEATDDAQPFMASSGDVSSRTKTKESVDWGGISAWNIPEEQEILEKLKKTKKFDLLPVESQEALGELKELMELVELVTER